MKIIADSINNKLRPIFNCRYNFFDNNRICNLYENRINKVFFKFYNLDSSIQEQLKQDIYEATEIREGER
jgi:hypothetical protein